MSPILTNWLLVGHLNLYIRFGLDWLVCWPLDLKNCVCHQVSEQMSDLDKATLLDNFMA